MRTSGIGRVLSVTFVAVAIGAAGCGSSSKKTSSTSTTKHAKTTKKVVATKTYHAGEFCSRKSEAVYRADRLKCVKVKGAYRLEKS